MRRPNASLRQQALQEAIRVFDTETAAKEWLNAYCPAIDAVPILLLDTPQGLQTVLRELIALEHGLPP